MKKHTTHHVLAKMPWVALVLGILLLLFAVSIAQAETGNWNAASKTVRSRSATMVADAKETKALVSQDRQEVTAEVAAETTQADAVQLEYDAVLEAFNALLKEEEALNLELAEEQEAIKALEGAIRQAAKEADELLTENPLTAVEPARREVVTQLLDDHSFPGLPAIEQLVDLYFKEIGLTGTVQARQGEFMGRDGQAQQGDILHIGPFTTTYRTPGGDIGFLVPSAKDARLMAVEGEAPAKAKEQIASFFEGSAALIPLDVSNGAVFRRLAAEKTWEEWLQAGGLLVYPILLVGILGLLLGVERFFTLGRNRAFSAKRMAEITDYVERGEFEECRDYCARGKHFPACRVLGSALNHVGESQEVLENSLQEAILRELPRLERFLPTMHVLAAIAPLLGLLGTVTGMINTFEVITLFGTGDPRMMSGGISEALVTTQLGLAVAIPIMVLHHFLERRVDGIVGDMEQKGTAFTVTLLQHQTRAA